MSARRLLSGFLSVVVGLTAQGCGFERSAPEGPVWQRLYRHFYIRTSQDGTEFSDGIDPLLWDQTKYVLQGPTHLKTLQLLDEFLTTRAERSIADPVERAMLQREMLAVFDWTANLFDNSTPECLALQSRLGQVIKRLSLSPEEIARVPDTYGRSVAAKAFAPGPRPDRPDEPFLPSDLLQDGGSWVCLQSPSYHPVALTHFEQFNGRSTFLVFMRLPQGRQATLDYLKRLQEYHDTWTPGLPRPRQAQPDPRPPQFPAGTAVALVRRAMLVDSGGSLVPSLLTETVQMRVYRIVPDGDNVANSSGDTQQDVYEFKLDRARLLAGDAASLRPLPRDAAELPLFMTHGMDPFEEPDGRAAELPRPQSVFRRCPGCHQGPGILSVQSYQQDRQLLACSVADGIGTDAYSKRRRYDWGLLQGIWHASEKVGRR